MTTRITGIDYANNCGVLVQRFPGQVVCGSIYQVPLNKLNPTYFNNMDQYQQHKTKLNYLRGFRETYQMTIPIITIGQALKLLWRSVCERIGRA